MVILYDHSRLVKGEIEGFGAPQPGAARARSPEDAIHACLVMFDALAFDACVQPSTSTTTFSRLRRNAPGAIKGPPERCFPNSRAAR